MLFLVAVLGCLVASSMVNVSEIKGYTERDLRRHIFANYDKFVRPVSNPDDTITVAAGISPLSIREFDKKNRVLVMDTYMDMEWNDDYLKWNPDEFNNITKLYVPNSLIWKPDLSVYTASSGDAVFPTSDANVLIKYDGSIQWVPFFTIKSRCPLQKTEEKPHVKCEVKIGSRTYSEELLNPKLYSQDVDLSIFEDSNPDWQLEDVSSIRQSKSDRCCPEGYPYLRFIVLLWRRWSSVSMDNVV